MKMIYFMLTNITLFLNCFFRILINMCFIKTKLQMRVPLNLILLLIPNHSFQIEMNLNYR